MQAQVVIAIIIAGASFCIGLLGLVIRILNSRLRIKLYRTEKLSPSWPMVLHQNAGE